ncbi:hypothetical protein NC653_025443 [Populus alba x Populus x berolinensis]|uniref:Transmembrane protein n=1 Tax=Populus alba x Populus x berolinensis TaxID=444605 RepID=A0AAD6MB92_9ROSI|nr:hypothetical protein NC653_025443 [Populus alba x Populus x berolinensis]
MERGKGNQNQEEGRVRGKMSLVPGKDGLFLKFYNIATLILVKTPVFSTIIILQPNYPPLMSLYHKIKDWHLIKHSGEGLQKYEGPYPGWSPEPAKLMPWVFFNALVYVAILVTFFHVLVEK